MASNPLPLPSLLCCLTPEIRLQKPGRPAVAKKEPPKLTSQVSDAKNSKLEALRPKVAIAARACKLWGYAWALVALDY